MRTTNQLRAEAKSLESQIKSGKISGPTKTKKAKSRIQALRYHADRRDGKASEKAKAKPKMTGRSVIHSEVVDRLNKPGVMKKIEAEAAKYNKRRAKKPVEGQGFLPSFLSQMSTVKIEELVADRLYKRLESKVDEFVDRILPVAKAE